MSLRHTSIGVIVLVALSCAAPRAARGEVFVLRNGGRVVGEVVDNPGADKDTVTVKTADGVQVTLAKSQIKEWIRQRPAEVEYEKVRAHYADTVEGQWALAEWCRERGLTSQRETHLKRVIQLEPGHQKAHFGLGHTQINGQWTTQEEVMRKQGMVFYKGRWRLPQEKELEEEKRQIDVAEKEWKKKLKQWRGLLGGNKDNLARDSIRTIKAPVAVRALGDAMRDDSDPAVRLLFVEALAQIGTSQARMELAFASVNDAAEEVRLTCLDHLKKEKDPEVVKFYAAKLRDPNNRTVNRAAAALKEMGDKSVIGPLIDALVTTHKQKVNSGNPGQISSSFGTGGIGGGGMTMGGGGPKIIVHHLSNRAVLDALVTLAEGPNFAFDVPKWKEWYALQKKTKFLDSRRD